MTAEKWLSRPLSEFIRTVAVSVAESQEELDRRSLRVQREIDRETAAGERPAGLDAAWLRFSEIEADLQVTLSLEGKEIKDPQTKTVRGYRPRISVQPARPTPKGKTEITSDITSDLRFRLTPTPPVRSQ
jgi:hypothetical protein